MTKTKEMLVKVLEVWIINAEMQLAEAEKNKAIKEQDFEAAVKWRSAEVEARGKLPTLDKLNEWKTLLLQAAD